MKLKLVSVVETLFLILFFFLVNIRSFIFWSLFPEANSFLGDAWRDVFLWLLVLLLMVFLLKKHNLTKRYFSIWLKVPFLFGFVLFSLASVGWSTAWMVTLHRCLVFVFASAVAIFLGARYSLNDILQKLYWVGVVIVGASFFIALANPAVGTDLNPEYGGAWRGIFWHKNQLGNILPIFNFVFLIRFFRLNLREMPFEKISVFVFYFLSLIGVFFANSASGYILVLLLHFSLGVAFLWLKIRHFLSPIHYYIMLTLFLAGTVVVLTNLEYIFGLFNREITFTGRVPMWSILLRDVFPQHPWFGQGFGTIWANLDFRLYMRDSVGWSYPVMIGDNGFLDIMLNLGIIGLVLFLLNYLIAWINSVQYFLRNPSLESFFLPGFMLYTFFVNLTFSLFMETEVFVWALIIVVTTIAVIGKDDGPVLHSAI